MNIKINRLIEESGGTKNELVENLIPKMKFLWEWKDEQIEPKKVVDLIKKEADEIKTQFIKQFRELTNQQK